MAINKVVKSASQNKSTSVEQAVGFRLKQAAGAWLELLSHSGEDHHEELVLSNMVF